MKLRVLASLVVLVGVASALQCNSCDSFINCNRPFPVPCPPHSKCYTLTSRDGAIAARGCAHSCDAITFMDGSHCQTCHHRDYCNDAQPPIGQGTVMRQSPEIGGGVQPYNNGNNNNNGYHIGHGVHPRRSATHASFGALLALPVFRRFLL